MTSTHKILWTEGMFLRPHHFQQAEAHWQATLWAQRCDPYPWGFSRLSVNHGLLALGKVALDAAAGVMPDGTAFDFDDAADAPAALDIGPGDVAAVIVLALPISRPGRESVIFKQTADSPARYIGFDKEVSDINAFAVGSATLQCGRLRLRLMPESALNGEWVAMGAVRIRERGQDGGVALDSGYIPPLLTSRASRALQEYHQELSGLLGQRRRQMARHLQQLENGREAAELPMLALLHRFGAVVDHGLALPGAHPERLFAEWLPFALELMAFRPPYGYEAAAPRYDHRNLGNCFADLMALLRQGLFLALEDSVIPLPLSERMPGLSVATLPAAGGEGFDLYLTVAEDMSSPARLAAFMAQIKIAPVCRIRDLVQLQLPGLGLRPLRRPPRQLPYRADMSCFALELGGELGQLLADTGTLAVYLAGELSGLRMALWALRRPPATLGGGR